MHFEVLKQRRSGYVYLEITDSRRKYKNDQSKRMRIIQRI